MADDWIVYSLVSVSAFVFCVSSALLYARYTSRRTGAAAKAEDMDDAREVVKIMYGTQTGTAEKFAKQAASALNEKYGGHTRFAVIDVEDFDHEQMGTEKMMIFILATYGDGEPTDNAFALDGWLHSAADDVMNGNRDMLTDTSFAVFGLGNKQYEHFNAMGKRVFKHLDTMGGEPLLKLGLGDDDADIADDFATWLEELLTAVEQSGLLQASQGEKGVANADAAYEVETTSSPANSCVDAHQDYVMGSSHAKPPSMLQVRTVRELHGAASDRSCVHVEIELNPGMSYTAGDHVAIFGVNNWDVVERACRVLGTPPDLVISVRLPTPNPAMLPPPFPSPLPLREALAHHCELQQSPDKEALRTLAAHATDPAHAARLSHLASHDGRNDYAAYVTAAKRSILDIMEDFPSARPSLGIVFAQLFPRMLPRYYSISSSPMHDARHVSVTAAVIDEITPAGRHHYGVATQTLARCTPGDRLPGALRVSTFRLPADSTAPLVMVGPGTGLAPFRGFLQERAALAAQGRPLGPAMLFFGCRHPDQDYLYRQELEDMRAAGALTMLEVAFSRVGASKDYVQHHLAQHRAAVVQALEAGGHLYVCGDARHMAKDVHAEVEAAVQACRGCSAEEAKAFVRELQHSHRYMQDVW
eukprot:jgi/Ulvmu1/7680/UM038_0111.1